MSTTKTTTTKTRGEESAAMHDGSPRDCQVCGEPAGDGLAEHVPMGPQMLPMCLKCLRETRGPDAQSTADRKWNRN